jgi:hypothetical protein
MKQLFKITLIVLTTLVSFTACRESDEDITPSGNYSPIRGGFPQGDSELDKRIYQIKQDYGVYLLYKDVTETDMNRTWESVGTGNIIVAGDEADRKKNTWDLPFDHLPFYVDFFDNYIFPNITKEFAQSTFPVKIYMINNLREEPRNIGKDKENGENNDKAGTGVAPNKNLHIGTFDNWVISFPEDVAKGTETGAEAEYMLKQQRCIFMTNVIKNSIQKGDIKAPVEFWSDYSMNKDAQCSDGKHDSCDKVYVPTDTVPNLSEEKIREFKEGEKGLYTLGYVDVLEEKFGTGNTTRIKKQIYNKTRGWNHPDYWTSKVNPTCDLFEAFIMNAMWFTPEEFHKEYNTDKNTLIKKKYDFVVDYMKKQYGIDLVGIAYGKKKE